MSRVPPSPLVLLLCAACAPGGPAVVDGATATDTAGERAEDPRLAAARRALDEGLADVARDLVGAAGAGAGVPGLLIEARALFLEGDAVGALRAVEQARARAPRDDRVFATAAEVLAGLGRRAAAEEEIEAGWAAAGKTAALERARGVLALATPGGAEAGLRALERARELDPALPWVDGPLVQARVLVGRLELSRERPAEALRLAREAYALDPRSGDVRELLAEASSAVLDFDTALALYADLEAEGRDLGDTRALLHHRAATFLLMSPDALVSRDTTRAAALEHYRAARALGLNDEALGFGATALRQAAVAELDRGIARYEAGDLEGARERFTEALRLDETALEAQNHLAVVRFQLGDHEGAARLWSELVERALERRAPLPDPVHLNLARAWHLAGRSERAEGVLRGYLVREPDGTWAEDTRAMLARLEADRASAAGE